MPSNSSPSRLPVYSSGEIVISFNEADGQYSMIIKDNGVGFPKDLNLRDPSSLGLTIVNALTGQLDGDIDFSPGGGLEICITFPAN